MKFKLECQLVKIDLYLITNVFSDVVSPTIEWTFDSGTNDTLGNFEGYLNGNAFVDGGNLHVGNIGDYMSTRPFNISTNCTLELQVTLDSLTTVSDARF